MNDSPPPQRPDDLDGLPAERALQLLAERVGGQAHARMVYGDPVERDGITVVPVAQVRWGFGMGSGFREAPMRTGGGGAIASPAGYLEISAGGCRYVPISRSGGRPPAVLGALATSALARWLRSRRS